MQKNIQGKSFKGCNLTNVDFTNADIKRADFTNAVLTNAIFSFTKAGLQKRQAFFLVSCFLILSAFSGYLLALGGVPLVRSLTYEPNMIAAITTVGSLVAFFVITLRRGFVLGICSALLALMPTLILSITPIQKASTIAVGFYNGLEALSLIAVGLAIIALSTSGAAITLNSLTVAIFGTSIMAILAALTLKRNESVPTTAIISLIGHYIAWRALVGDRNFTWIRSIAVAFTSIGGTSFRNADLTNACFSYANLKSTNLQGATLNKTCFHNAKNLEYARIGSTILSDPVVRDLVVDNKAKSKSLKWLNLKGANLAGADLRGADLTGSDLSDATLEGACLEQAILIGTNLKGANLTRADFSYANLKEADLTEANLQQACLEWTNITNALAVGTNFTQAKLTGACLGEVWNIDSTTKLEEVECNFYYVLEQPKPGTDDRDRQPASGEFAPGDFTRLHTKIRDTVQVLLRNGANHPEAFFRGFKQLMEENPEIDFSSIQGYQRKDSDILLDIAVPEGIEKAKIHGDLLEAYETRLEAQKALLELETRHSRDIKDITMALATNPSNLGNLLSNLTIIASGESTTMTDNKNQGINATGSFVNTGEMNNMMGSTINLGEISGNVTNAVNQLPAAPEPDKPGIKELLTELQTLIEAETNLTDKNKEKALKQVKLLAEAAQNPKAEEKQDLADTAITMLKGIITALPSAAKLIEACTTIAVFLGLA
jgi:uncharacterized protein YjbI with pentapeptide repeats